MVTPAPDSPPPSLSDAAVGNLRYIRATMDASGTFTSVPGVGSLGVGVIGSIAGGLVLFTPLGNNWLGLWLAAAALAMPLGGWLLARKALRAGVSLSSGVGRRFVYALLPGFAAAALLTLGLLSAGVDVLIPATWLMLYGASVSAAGALSVLPVRSLGMSCMVAGVIALAFPGWGQPLLLLGFGALHLIHGTWIWRQCGG